MPASTVRPDIEALIERRAWPELRKILSRMPEPEVADLLPNLDKPKRVLLFRALPRQVGAEVFAYLEPADRDGLLSDLTDEETRRLLADLAPDDRAQLLDELPGQVTQRLLNFLDPGDLEEVRVLLGYPEESVGRLMTPDYVAVRAEWSVAQALEQIRRKGRDSETINVVYVTDNRWRLLGVASLRRLILADPTATVEDVMTRSVVKLDPNQDREEGALMMQRYDLYVMPVVDSAGILLGIVTFDDLWDVVEEEATEDFHKGAAVAPVRESLRDAAVGLLYRKRIGWLLVLVFANIFSGAAIAYFEETIAAVVALVFFLPLLIDSSGNAGSQSATLIIRSLAVGDVQLRDWAGLLGKELLVAGALGVTMGLAVWGLGIYRAGPEVAMVVALTTVAVVVIGSTIGMSLPFLLHRMGLDPATASAPLITSLADIVGLVIYFSIATWYLGL